MAYILAYIRRFFIMYHLEKTAGRFYFYCRVPKDLIGLIGRKEIKKALRTTDRRAAKMAIKTYSMELERLGGGARAS